MTKLPNRFKHYYTNDEDYQNMYEALGIAWEALEYGFNGQTIKQPGMSVQSRPLTNSEIRLSLEAAMSRIQKLGDNEKLLDQIAKLKLDPNDPRIAKQMTEEELRTSKIRLGEE